MAQLGEQAGSVSLASSPGELTKMEESVPSASGSNEDSDDFDVPLSTIARPSRMARKRPLPVVSDTSDDDGIPLGSLARRGKQHDGQKGAGSNKSPAVKKIEAHFFPQKRDQSSGEK